MPVSLFLLGVANFARRHAVVVVCAVLLLAGVMGWYSFHSLGLNSDVDTLFSESLPWRQRQIAFSQAFPQFTDLLIGVIEAEIPEEADATAADLAQRLAQDTAHFKSVRRPDAMPFFDQEGMLFLSKKELEDLLNRVIDAQPFLGQLALDPTARGLFGALGLLGVGIERGEVDLGPYLPSLRAFEKSLAAARVGVYQPLSWQRLIGGSAGDVAGKYRFVLVQPKMNYGALQPGAEATRAMRQAASTLEFIRSGAAKLRITGPVALSDEEFATVAHGMLTGTLASLALITLWLFLAVRSWRIIVPILLTLLVGFAFTSAFAAATVGTLNLISLAFAILFVGIAVDFAIQFAVRFREMVYALGDVSVALAETARRVGVQILLAAVTAAAGFYAFVPTKFLGVAELGLIAGSGMLIAFVCTLGFLPAALALFRPPGEITEVALPFGAVADRLLSRWRLPVIAIFTVIGLAGAAMVPRLVFDADPLHTKDPNTEAMRTLYDLLDDPLTNPYSVESLEPSLQQAEALAERLRKLPLVDTVLTLGSFVPEDQAEKLEMISDAANILAPTLASQDPPAPLDAAQIRMAIDAALASLDPAARKLEPEHPLVRIAADLHALKGASDASLLALNRAVTLFLPDELKRLRTALQAKQVTLQDLPEEIRRDWLLPDGRARIQVLGTPATRSSAGMRALVESVRKIIPEAGGSAGIIIDTSDTILSAFRSAVIGALLAIGAILLLVLRRVVDAALVMAPLLLSALLTALFAVSLPLPLNFANIIALPLLLGVGVSFNVYFVMNWRAGATRFLGSATARAVLFSALTTGTAFGSLALSAHPGTASMGELLLLSLGATLITTFVFMPALLSGLHPAERGKR